MSFKECGGHQYNGRQGMRPPPSQTIFLRRHHTLLRRIFAGVVAFIVLILFIIFLKWIILRPTKPTFMLQDATVFAFNLSSSHQPSPSTPTPNTITVKMQVTLLAHNPNKRIGIYYQKLDVYATYRSQQISLPTVIPATYQGHKDSTVWSPFLYGASVPVSPYTLSSLQQDQNNGEVMVNVKVNGRVKWRVGTWISGKYHINVNCPAYIRFVGDQNGGVGVVAPAVKYQLLHSCSVDE